LYEYTVHRSHAFEHDKTFSKNNPYNNLNMHDYVHSIHPHVTSKFRFSTSQTTTSIKLYTRLEWGWATGLRVCKFFGNGSYVSPNLCTRGTTCVYDSGQAVSCIPVCDGQFPIVRFSKAAWVEMRRAQNFGHTYPRG